MQYDKNWATEYLESRGYRFDITEKWGLTIDSAPNRKPTIREKIDISILND